MRYFGGKARIAKKIVAYLNSIRDGRPYIEPFVGAANVFCLMDNPRYGSDIHHDLMMLLYEVQHEWFQYPEFVSEELYDAVKLEEHPSALKAFIGFGCSYAGKWFGGYARDGKRDFCKNATSSLKKKAKQLQGAVLNVKDYRMIFPENSLIYCDPPYLDTTQPYGTIRFDTKAFWDQVRVWSMRNTVIVSEYVAPDDFECVLEIPTRTDILGKGGQYKRVERLFRHKGYEPIKVSDIGS